VTDRLAIGLIGASHIAVDAILAPARTLRGIDVVAVAARDANRARLYAADHEIPRVHATYEALLADPAVDLVYVSTTPDTHAALAIGALEAGKAVLVEKPFSVTADEARAVQAVAVRRGRPVWEAMHSPHHALFRRIVSLLEEGRIGRLRRIEANFLALIDYDPLAFRWRAEHGGGALMDLGVYLLAWCRRVAGEDFEIVSAHAEMRNGVDASFNADLVFGGDVVASLRASMLAPELVTTLIVEGDAGSIEVSNAIAPQTGHALRLNDFTGSRVAVADGPTTYEAQLTAVRAALVYGQPFPFPADDYVRSMEALDRVRRAFANPRARTSLRS
jgi:predicted dehydrogenase